MSAMNQPSLTYDGIADRLIEIAIDDDRIRAVWVEADAKEKVRRPYAALEIHLAADEPLFPAVVAGIEELMAPTLDVEVLAREDTQRLARQLSLAVRAKETKDDSALPVTLIIEQSCYLAKRPRAWVVPLHDKTTHLCHVMDFSARR